MAIKVEYYSDVLCVWAWIAQRRLDELRQHFGSELELEIHYVNVFGNTNSQIGEKWASRGGFDGFGQHVIEAAAPFSNAAVVDSIWQTVRPLSSTPAHTVLKAVEISHSVEAAEKFAYKLREQFFTVPIDIGQLEVLLDLADDLRVEHPGHSVVTCIRRFAGCLAWRIGAGEAFADLSVVDVGRRGLHDVVNLTHLLSPFSRMTEAAACTASKTFV